jgi:branched-chain amino acid transport system substrate-binding protein
MKMKRLSLIALLSLLMSLALIACTATPAEDTGGGSEEVMATEAAPAEEAPAEEAPAEEPMEEVACTDAIGCVEIASGDPILLASALSISGDTADLGTDSQRGVEIAIAERGELFGRPIELAAEDDGCNAEGGQTSATKIVANPQVVGVIGTTCSGAGVPAAKIISDAGYVMISPSNTSPALTDPAQAFAAGYLRTAHNDLVQGQAVAEFAYNELGVRKAAAIHDGDPYTEGLARAFSDAFTALGGEIVAFEAESKEATNVEPLLTSIAAAGPEFLFYPVFMPLGGLLTNTARIVPGLENTILAAADGLQSQTLLDAAGDAAEGMYMSGPNLEFTNTAYTETFVPAYVAAFGEEPINLFHAHAYDAANLILDAIEAVGQETADGTLLVGRQALRDHLYATSGYQGLTGTLTCNETGDCADANIAIQKVEGGDFNQVWSSK